MAKEKTQPKMQMHHNLLRQLTHEKLTDTQMGIIWRAVGNYELHGEETQVNDVACEVLLSGVYEELKKNRQAYEEKVEKNTQAQIIRWEKERQRQGIEGFQDAPEDMHQDTKSIRSRQNQSAAEPLATTLQVVKEGMSEDEIQRIEPEPMPDEIREKFRRLRVSGNKN